MRRTLGLLGALGLVSAGVFACDQSTQIQTVPLGFTIGEGLLEVQENDPTTGAVILSSTSGNCSTYQQGFGVKNILGTQALVFTLQVQDNAGGYLPLTAGTYNVEMGYNAGAGNFALATEIQTTLICSATQTGANSGTVTVQPFNPDAGATSVVSYTIVFGNSQFVGSFPLNTCIIPATAPEPDAGACNLPGGGGPT
jgi:hypothetical protein